MTTPGPGWGFFYVYTTFDLVIGYVWRDAEDRILHAHLKPHRRHYQYPRTSIRTTLGRVV